MGRCGVVRGSDGGGDRGEVGGQGIGLGSEDGGKEQTGRDYEG